MSENIVGLVRCGKHKTTKVECGCPQATPKTWRQIFKLRRRPNLVNDQVELPGGVWIKYEAY